MTSLQKTYPLNTATVLADIAPVLDGLARCSDIAGFNAIAAALPIFCHAGFECPLGNDEPGLDFLHCLRRQEESRYLVQATSAHDVWQRLRHFGALWRDGADGLDQIPNCWLEFDLGDRAALDFPIPSLFLNIPAIAPAAYDAILDQVCAALRIQRSSTTRAAMMRLQQVFGPVSSACETGFWLARPVTAVRMVFTKIEASANRLTDLLAGAGHPAPSILRRAPLPALWPRSGAVAVAVDVDDEIAPDCAVELYPLPPDKPFPIEAQIEAQRRLLQDLVAGGLCTARKSARVTAWQGRRCYGQDTGLDAGIWLRRGINHIKLSVKPHRPVSAKAYLSLSGLALKLQRTTDALA